MRPSATGTSRPSPPVPSTPLPRLPSTKTSSSTASPSTMRPAPPPVPSAGSPDAQFCQNISCGVKQSIEARFCSKCGTRLVDGEPKDL